jgi:hypothetical protein
MVGGIIPLRRATSSRYDGRLEQESAEGEHHHGRRLRQVKPTRLTVRPEGANYQ